VGLLPRPARVQPDSLMRGVPDFSTVAAALARSRI
jgi:hypothetical protein